MWTLISHSKQSIMTEVSATGSLKQAILFFVVTRRTAAILTSTLNESTSITLYVKHGI